jgi:hypothetical protein
MNRPAPKYPEIKEAYELLDGLALLRREQQQQEEELPELICAWCGATKREGPGPASHGICDPCAEKEFGGYIIGVIARSALPPEPRRVRWVHLWPFWSFLFAALLLCTQGVAAQVTAQTELRNGVAELRVGNPTASPLAVELSLYRDATKPDEPVTLGDSVSALISPRSFVLQSGEIQVVKLRVRETVKANELLRLAVLFTPYEAQADVSTGVRVLFRTRLITKVKAVAP